MQPRELCLWSERGQCWGFPVKKSDIASTAWGQNGGIRVVCVTTDVDQLTADYLADQRTHPDGSPWVLLNMIASADGAVSIDGVSGGLGNDADFAIFKTLRSVADVILVAAGTARAEKYRAPTVSDEVREQRRGRGQQDLPTIAVVTRSLDLDLDGPLFGDEHYRPAVVTVTASPAADRAAVAGRAEVFVAGDTDVDLSRAVRMLGETYGPVVLAEGGPTLNAQLADADLFDELCLTTAPLLVGGDSARIVANGPAHAPRSFTIDRVKTAGDLVFARYLRRR